MPRGLVGKGVVVGNTLLLLAELLQLLYWSCVLTLSLTLLMERDTCLVSPGRYAFYFIALRFPVLLRMLPRHYALLLTLKGEVFVFTAASCATYFPSATSALVDVHVAKVGGGVTTQLWKHALRDLLRQAFTSGLPGKVENTWTPPNYTQLVQNVLVSNVTTRVVSIDYGSSSLLLSLGLIDKLVVAAYFGLVLGVLFVPLRSFIFGAVPKRDLFLYKTLCGGTSTSIDVGARLQNDLRPEDRKRI
ncbi:uncharacterized protein Tco025E_04075 [Trypanosoma conorhini]|uniref:Uncharacterized protein n=1 Tax=Trypanosoma conorhini TaxID=83891 RepID=A0A422PPX3_9TRYP|nr:uncharacterized protein Tco025E_04075 [Trypanosoma conorhini]RNF19567.1 hypothetical protein Tco025E_04075 [Trypanosoma conorhini]